MKMEEDKENQMEEDKENRMEVDKENLADNSQDSQVSQEDIRAGYRTLIKDLAAAEDTILGADGAENVRDNDDDRDEENEEVVADAKTDGLFDHMRQVGTVQIHRVYFILLHCIALMPRPELSPLLVVDLQHHALIHPAPLRARFRNAMPEILDGPRQVQLLVFTP